MKIEEERVLKTDYTIEQVAKDAAHNALTRLPPKDFVIFMELVKAELVKGMQHYLVSIEEETKSANTLYEKLRGY